MKYLMRYLDWCAALLLPDEPDDWTIARARVVMAGCYILMIIVLVGCALVLRAQAETPDEWLSLVSQIQRTPCAYKDNSADELFIAKMINVLTLDNPPEPTRAEKKWILTLKRQCLRSPS